MYASSACGVFVSSCICTVCCPAAELEKKVYDLKRYIKTLHDTVPSTGSIPMPASPATSRPTSAEVPSWVAKDLSLEIKPMVLVRQILAVYTYSPAYVSSILSHSLSS